MEIPKLNALGIIGSDLKNVGRRVLEGFKFLLFNSVFIHQLVELTGADAGRFSRFTNFAFMAGQNILQVIFFNLLDAALPGLGQGQVFT